MGSPPVPVPWPGKELGFTRLKEKPPGQHEHPEERISGLTKMFMVIFLLYIFSDHFNGENVNFL
jgi:hypothetical protein